MKSPTRQSHRKASRRGEARKSRAMDRDILVLRACARAIEKSSSPKMQRANVEFLFDHYVRNPSPSKP